MQKTEEKQIHKPIQLLEIEPPERGLNSGEIVGLILTLLCTAVVLVATHLPPEYVPKQIIGIGVGQINDKIAHAIAYGLITLCFLVTFRRFNSWRLYTFFIIIIGLVAMADEMTQPFVKRTASPYDILGDYVGVIIVYTFFSSIQWIVRKCSKKTEYIQPKTYKAIPTNRKKTSATNRTTTQKPLVAKARAVAKDSEKESAAVRDENHKSPSVTSHVEEHSHPTSTSSVPFRQHASYQIPYTEGIFEIAWAGRWFIIICAIIGVTVAYFQLQRITPLYTSSSQILVEKPEGQMVNGMVQAVGAASSNYMQTQASMITSRQIVSAALRDPNLISLPTFQDEEQVAELVKTLTALAGKKNDIISISATSPYPEDAAQFVNVIVQSYIAWHEANRKVSTADLLKDLNAQFEDSRDELQLKRREKLLYEQRYPEVVNSGEGSLSEETLNKLKKQLVEARLVVISADTHKQRVDELTQEPDAFRAYIRDQKNNVQMDLNERERTSLWQELLKTRLEIQALSDDLAIRKSHRQILNDRVESLEKNIAELDAAYIKKHVTLAAAQAQDAQNQIDQLQTLYQEELGKVQDIPGQHPEYTFINSECQTLEKLCDTILKQINDLDLNARFEGLNIHILEEALAASLPSYPQKARILGMGMMLGLAVGAALAWLRSNLDQRIRSADEITSLLGVPILGVIPTMPKRYISNNGHPAKLMEHDRASEAYRVVRTTLLFNRTLDKTNIVLVTSPEARAGKSTLISNLGAAMAQAGRQTVIIDADLRKPSQHRIFSLDAGHPGFTDIVAGNSEIAEAIQSTHIPGLDIISGGGIISNPTELLSSPVLAQVLSELREQYDCILIDSPPVGMMTDAQILASNSDLALIVVRAKQTNRIATQQTRQALHFVGAHIVGTVVNDVTTRDKKFQNRSLFGSNYSRYGTSERIVKQSNRPTVGLSDG